MAIAMFCANTPLPTNASSITPAECTKKLTNCVFNLHSGSYAEDALNVCIKDYVK